MNARSGPGQSELLVQSALGARSRLAKVVGMQPQTSHATFQRAFQAGDSTFDGTFVGAVRTTGIYCRPSCTARKPNPKNLEFFDSNAQAEKRGYRPCRRCKPREWIGASPAWVLEIERTLREHPQRIIPNAELERFGVHPVTARRWFHAHRGTTFQAWQRALRVGRGLRALAAGLPVEEAGEASAYQSASGFRAAFHKLFGQPARPIRGLDVIWIQRLASPLGTLIAGATREGVCLLEFVDRRALAAQIRRLERHFKRPAVLGEARLLTQLEHQLTQYFEQRRTQFELDLIAPGTAFEERVWSELQTIPPGQTQSYDDLARKLGKPGAARAIGGAVGRNRLAILIPCHRVVRSDGSLCGYAGGLWRKRRLLELEGGLPSADG